MTSNWEKYPGIIEDVYKKSMHMIEPYVVSWENIFYKDWDACVLLDACRYDLFREASDNYDFINSHWSITSADSMTPRWMERTFTHDISDELEQTAYVCGNPFAEKWVDKNLLGHFEPVYSYGWNNEIGTVSPEKITDAAIRIGRESDYKRVLIHYMQPHVPFIQWRKKTEINTDNFSFERTGNPDTWTKLKKGEVDLGEVKDAYRENLQFVLDKLPTLVNNFNAEQAVLTSDHGNGYGEWGIYGHPMHMPHRALREVPWASISMTDTESYEPSPTPTATTEQSRYDQLQALGYT